MSCGVGCRCGSDLVWLWLCHRQVATALIWPLAWEPSYATSAALKRQKRERERDLIESLVRNNLDLTACTWKRVMPVPSLGKSLDLDCTPPSPSHLYTKGSCSPALILTGLSESSKTLPCPWFLMGLTTSLFIRCLIPSSHIYFQCFQILIKKYTEFDKIANSCLDGAFTPYNNFLWGPWRVSLLALCVLFEPFQRGLCLHSYLSHSRVSS